MNLNKANWEAIEQKVPKNTKIHGVNDPYNFLKMDKDLQIKLLVWCLTLSKHNKINKKYSSYGLKHVFEENLNGEYITNGEFKGAMLVAGFEIDKVEESNWCFNVNDKDIKFEKQRNEENYQKKIELRRWAVKYSNPELLSNEERQKWEEFKKYFAERNKEHRII